MKLNPALNDFPADMVAACNAAIDAGLFYNTEFDAFVLKRMGGYGCEAVLMEIADLDSNASDHFEAQRALCQRLEAAVVAAPRGHYAVLRFAPMSHRGTFYKLMVSDGHGDRPANGGAHDSYDALPTGEKVLQRMVEYEIYLCRQVLEKQRATAKRVAAAKEHGLCAGYTHKGAFRVGTDTFSTVSIIAMGDDGQVKLHMTKRGSPKRYEVWIGAGEFARRAGLVQKREEAQAPAGSGLFELAA